MDRFFLSAEVQIELLHEERRDRGREDGDIRQNLVEGLVGGEFVGVHPAAPEALPVEPDVPIGNVVADEILDQASRRGDVVVFVGRPDVLDQGIEQRNDPAVDLRSLGIGHGSG